MSLRGNILVGQAGGPTAVINSSLYGLVVEAKKYDFINKVYGAVYGIEGVIKKQIIDFGQEKNLAIKGLKWTPGAALGACRYKLSENFESNNDLKTIFKVFEEYNISYFFYIGGNDSMDTCLRIDKAARKLGYELRVIGVPKTVDNDLLGTYYCPGFGSGSKYIATSVREAGLHAVSMYTSEPITILQTVGRNTGWLPGASALAREDEADAPHLIYFPEIPFSIDRFLEDVQKVYQKIGGAFIVVGEGLKDADGNYINVQSNQVATDPFGHATLGGISEFLKEAIESNLKIRTTNIKLDICQQSAMHFASKRDADDAEKVGRNAVKAAFEGLSGYMSTLVMDIKNSNISETGLIELEKVANFEREVPRELINGSGNYVTESFLDYVRPLILGEVEVPIVNGLPSYVKLRKIFV